MIRQLISLTCDTDDCKTTAGNIFDIAQRMGWKVQRLTEAPGFGHAICPACVRKTGVSA